MAYFSLQADFSKGQISALLGARADVDFWRQSLSECVNFQVLTHGGLRRRSGTRFISEVADSTALARIFPFKFSEAQSYVLSFNGGKIRFLAQRGVVGSPYEISHPYADGDLDRISYTQFNDVAYLAHRAYPPNKLSRAGDVNWSLTDVEFTDGPYLSEKVEGTTLTLSNFGSPVPTMTSNTAPSGTASASVANAYLVFDRDTATEITTAPGEKSGFVAYTFGGSSTRVVDGYYITASTYWPVSAPSKWVFEGFDGTNYIAIDTQTGITFTAGETKFFDTLNETAYRGYRLRWTGIGSNSPDDGSSLAELGLHERAQSQAPFNLTASSTAGINGGTGFLPSDVGRAIRLLASDGRWRWAQIVSRVSATVVTVRLYDHALPDLNPIARWQLGAFSTDSGYPGTVTLFNERLMWARTDAEPVTVYGSRQGNFDKYGVSDPPVDTDGIKITLLSSGMNEIVWLSGDEDLVTGSAGQIRTVGPADITKSFSATNVTQRKGPTTGADHLQPLSAGGVTLYAGACATKIRELVMGEQNRYVAPELSLLGEQFFKTGIVDWAFAERPDPTIYCVMGNGELVGVTYDREQRVVGFARHMIAKGFVESVAVVPSPMQGYEDVHLVVRRTINGQTKRYIEVLERPFDGDIDTVHDAFHVDCGLSYDGAPITTVTGLGHLEGEEVAVLADGGVVDDLVVSGGSITLPYAASKISVGLRYKSRGVTLSIAGPQQDGTMFGRKRTAQGVGIDVLNSGAVMMGAHGSENWTPPLYEQIYKTGDTLFGKSVQLQSGVVPCQIEGSWIEGDGKIVFETDQPLPLLIRSLILQVEGEP